MKNFYAILEVRATADQQEIKKAYRRLAKIHHPDVGGSTEKMKEINEAYETLSNLEKRIAYDEAFQNVNRGSNSATTSEPRRTSAEPTEAAERADRGPYRTPENIQSYIRYFRNINATDVKLDFEMLGETLKATIRVQKNVKFDFSIFERSIGHLLGAAIRIGYQLYLTEKRILSGDHLSQRIYAIMQTSLITPEFRIHVNELDDRDKLIDAFSTEFHFVSVLLIDDVLSQYQHKIPPAELPNIRIALEECFMLGYVLGIKEDSPEVRSRIVKRDRDISKSKYFFIGAAVLFVVYRILAFENGW